MLRATSVILVVFLVLCGGIALKHVLAGTPAPVAVFDGVSDEDLANEDIVLLDAHPSAEPGVPADGLKQIVLREPGVVVLGTQLVRIQLTNQGKPTSPPYLAWGLRLDTSGVPNESNYSGPGPFWIDHGPVLAIVFFDAETGADLATFERNPPGTTPFVGTQPPTYP